MENEYKLRIVEQLKDCSRSFRKKKGRHYLRTTDVIYCSFSTSVISIPDELSQRSARKRLEKFGIPLDYYRDKSVLDLGAHCGAMLLQLSNSKIKCGLGVEFDIDKVEMANDIAAASDLPNVKFIQGDIDTLAGDRVGVHDVVLALAIESHLNNKERLFDLLKEVTGKTLIFEGNANCDVNFVSDKLKAAGFHEVTYLGNCDDDIVPENNRRPIIIAYK